MRHTVILAIVIALFATPALAQEGCLTEDMVARWKTQGHPLKVTEYRLYQRDGKLLLETIYEDDSGRGDFEEMRKSGDVLRYVTKDTLDPETREMVAKPYDGVDFFKLPDGAIELWDDEGKWITAAPAPVCWKF